MIAKWTGAYTLGDSYIENAYDTTATLSTYSSWLRLYSGGDAVFGNNIYGDTSTRLIKQKVTGFYASWVRFYYGNGISFGAVSTAGVSGDTLWDATAPSNEWMFIKPSGYVGIGISAPTSQLEIVGANTSDIIRFTLGADLRYKHGISFTHSAAPSSSYLAFNLNTGTPNTQLERVRITGEGNVGIGTAAPISTLSVYGGLSMNYSYASPPALTSGNTSNEIFGRGSVASDFGFLRLSAGGGSTLFQKTAIDLMGYNGTPSDSNQIRFYNSGVQSAVIDKDGKVGIGTTSPSQKFHVKGTSGWVGSAIECTDAAGGPVQYFINDKGGNGAQIWLGGSSTGTPNTLVLANYITGGKGIQFATSGITVKMTILDNGFVGIGTVTPLSIFHTSSSQASKTTLGNSRVITLENSSGYVNELLEIGMGFKTSVTYQPVVVGHKVTDQTSNTKGSFYIATRDVVTDTAPTERLTVTSAGNVGIGTINPTVILDVTGDAHVSGRVTAGSKSFLIDHPSKEGWKLMHGSLEGPENGVYIRGILEATGNTAIIELPYYWKDLVDMSTITVNLTPIGAFQMIYLKKIQGEKIYIASDSNIDINATYWIVAERKDIYKLIVEFKSK